MSHKNRLHKFLPVLAALTIMFALPSPLRAQGTDPESVVAAFYEALNAGDVDAVAVFYADDAIVRFPDDDETLTGAEEILPWIEWLVEVNFVIEAESIQVEGDTVTVAIRTWADPSRELGIAPLEGRDVYIVKDGKIASQTSAYTEESNAKIQAALATLPETGGVTFPSSLLVTALGGLAILGGLGLALLRRRSLQGK
ncbi:MAG: nuclear transport factor 2 family protein [Anaerolineae bacterium]|nr:nuclear transport factor 2 family protein [Anaerolineae bacterium]